MRKTDVVGKTRKDTETDKKIQKVLRDRTEKTKTARNKAKRK